MNAPRQSNAQDRTLTLGELQLARVFQSVLQSSVPWEQCDQQRKSYVLRLVREAIEGGEVWDRMGRACFDAHAAVLVIGPPPFDCLTPHEKMAWSIVAKTAVLAAFSLLKLSD